MAIRIGSAVNYRTNFPGTAAIPPNNTGIGHIAQARLDNLVARANARHEQALRVDPNWLTFWVRQFSGVRCTCSKPLGAIDAQPVTLARKLPLSPKPGLPPVEAGSFRMVRFRGGQTISTVSDNPLASLAQPQVDPLDAQVDASSSDEMLATLRAEMGTASLALPPLSAGIYGGDKAPCGICLGTGFTQGYSLHNGRRVLCDASGEVPYMLQGADLDQQQYPNRFNLPRNGGWVQWQLELPTFTYKWLSLSVRNNLKPATSVIVEYASDPTNPVWVLLTLNALTSTDGTARTWLLRARRNPVLPFDDEQAAFTHVELSYLLAEPPLGQAPQLSYNMDYTAAQAIIRTTFEVAASIVKIPRESLFYDSKYKQIWKVLTVTPKVTATGQVFAYDLEARMVQRQEALYVICTAFQPFITLAYRGLEDVQGGQNTLRSIETQEDFYPTQEPPASTGGDTFKEQ